MTDDARLFEATRRVMSLMILTPEVRAEIEAERERVDAEGFEAAGSLAHGAQPMNRPNFRDTPSATQRRESETARIAGRLGPRDEGRSPSFFGPQSRQAQPEAEQESALDRAEREIDEGLDDESTALPSSTDALYSELSGLLKSPTKNAAEIASVKAALRATGESI